MCHRRYTEWIAWNGTAVAPDWDAGIKGVELYDHRADNGTDFDAYEVSPIHHHCQT